MYIIRKYNPFGDDGSFDIDEFAGDIYVEFKKIYPDNKMLCSTFNNNLKVIFPGSLDKVENNRRGRLTYFHTSTEDLRRGIEVYGIEHKKTRYGDIKRFIWLLADDLKNGAIII